MLKIWVFLKYTYTLLIYTLFLFSNQMIKNNVTDHKLNMEAIIKNINTISLELKKMNGK